LVYFLRLLFLPSLLHSHCALVSVA